MSRRLKRSALGAAIAIVVLIAIVTSLFETGLAERWMRHEIISQIQQRAGARAEIGGFHFHFWQLRIEIDDMTVHGLEASTLPPLFHADRIDVDVRILSFFGRKISLNELILTRPQVAVEIDASGHSNLPKPKSTTKRSWHEIPFQLRAGRFELNGGSVLFNNRRTPLNVTGSDFDVTLHHETPASAADFYVGQVQWQQVSLVARRDRPFRFDLSAKFTLQRDAFSLDEMILKLPHSELDARADLPSFERSEWDFRYRGRLSLQDVRTIMRSPATPDGIVDFSGRAHYASASAADRTALTSSQKKTENSNAREPGGEWAASGYYNAQGIRMRHQWFHVGGMETSGDYEVANRQLVVPDLKAKAMSGAVTGRLQMDFHGLAFRTETQARGVSLAQLFEALDNPSFPVTYLHWDGSVDVDSVNTWNANFKHFRSHGQTRWSPPAALQARMIPVTARIDYDYSNDTHIAQVAPSEIDTPKSRLQMGGSIGEKDSAMEVSFHADDLLQWNDFINVLRGPDATRQRLAGEVAWRGRVLGPIVGPTFAGHVNAAKASYGRLYWDQIDGDMEYSPDGFSLRKTMVKRGASAAMIDLVLKFDGDWGFSPSSDWTLDAHVERSPSDDLQAMFDTSYPVRGFLSGDFHGGGTRGSPTLDANFVYDDIEAKGLRFDSLTGHLHAEHDEAQLSGAELRRGTGTIAGDFLYRPAEQQAVFNVTGAGIALESLSKIQTSALPIVGRLAFKLKGSGPLRAPVGQGELSLTNLKLGTEAEGNFNGQVTSDGKNAHLTLSSEPARERLQGELNVGLAGDDPISGQLSVKDFDLDPFIVSGLHLTQLTGHSSADGTFVFSGEAARPDSIQVRADVTHIAFNYELVQLTNDQDIRLTYQRNEVRIEQAHLHGPDTDFKLSGSARFNGDRPIDFALSGGVNLRLVKGMLPDLDAQGRADLNVSIQGTMAQPQVTGRASVANASAHYADFPMGLSNVNGDLVFDKSRLLFDRVHAEAGGGNLVLSGNLSYGEGPLRYEVNVTTSQVRIRYPTGMSWLAGGTLQLSGTTTGGLVSGKVEVQRLLFAQGVDVASFFAAASQTAPGPPSTSSFLQNLAFDVEGQTSAGARIEWTGAHVEMDGDLRLRGTWDRPVLLGHIHLLSGEMPFRGNQFDLTRGDINFANPFRLDPVLDVELTTNISEYQVTIDFSGPASRLSLNYRSDPPLPDSDIVALLALGSPGEGSGLAAQPGSAQNYGATALLSEAISTGIGGRIEHLFGISQFRVDPFVAETATDSNAAARVTIQEQVARDLTITYSTNAATSNQYQMIQMVYNVKGDLSVEFLRDINGTYGFDIKWLKHFK